MSTIAIIGQFDIHPEDASAAAELMLAMMNATVTEQGCNHYAYSRDLADPNRFQLSELWQTSEALAGHFLTEHMATYRAGIAKLRVVNRTVKRYEIASSSEL